MIASLRNLSSSCLNQRSPISWNSEPNTAVSICILPWDPGLSHLVVTARQPAICSCIHHHFFPVYEQQIKRYLPLVGLSSICNKKLTTDAIWELLEMPFCGRKGPNMEFLISDQEPCKQSVSQILLYSPKMYAFTRRSQKNLSAAKLPTLRQASRAAFVLLLQSIACSRS